MSKFLQRAQSLGGDFERRAGRSSLKTDLLIFLLFCDVFFVQRIIEELACVSDNCLGRVEACPPPSITNFAGKAGTSPLGDIIDCLIHSADHQTVSKVPAQEIGMQQYLLVKQTFNHKNVVVVDSESVHAFAHILSAQLNILNMVP